MKTLKCPYCSKVLDAPDDVSEAVCPSCAQPVHLQRALPVIPLEHDLKRERRESDVALGFLIFLIAIGFFLLIYYAVTDSREQTIVTVGMILILIGGIAAAIVTARTAKGVQPDYELAYEEAQASHSGPQVLDYRKPVLQDSRAYRGATIVGQAIGGIVAGIVGILMCATSNAPMMLLAIPIVGVALLFVRGIRAVGIGVIISIPVAMLIIIGICSGFRL